MKKIVLSMICGVMLLGFVTGCGSKNTNHLSERVKEEFKSIYTIESSEIVAQDTPEGYDSYIQKFKTNDMVFYVYTYKWGNGLSPDTEIYSSILSSVYEKNKNEILSLGNKYNLDVTFNLTADSYSNYRYFNDSEIGDAFMTIEASSNQMDSIRNFVNDVMGIEEIKTLYNLHSAFVYDYSEIIIDENNVRTSIFGFYKSN